MPSKILVARVLSALRSAMDRFSFSFFGKTAIRKTGNLSLRQIYTTRAPPLFPIPWRATRTFRNPPVPVPRISDQLSTFWVSRNPCYDVRTLLLAEELVGNREVSRRLDHRLHNSLVLHWTPSVKSNCMPLDTNRLRRLQNVVVPARSKAWATGPTRLSHQPTSRPHLCLLNLTDMRNIRAVPEYHWDCGV